MLNYSTYLLWAIVETSFFKTKVFGLQIFYDSIVHWFNKFSVVGCSVVIGAEKNP